MKILIIFILETRDVLIMNKEFMRRMKNPPHTYTNLVKTKNSFTIHRDIYKKIDHKRMYKDYILLKLEV